MSSAVARRGSPVWLAALSAAASESRRIVSTALSSALLYTARGTAYLDEQLAKGLARLLARV